MPDAPAAPKNTLGMIGLIMGVLSLLTCGLLSPLAVFVSALGLRKEPRTTSIAGIVLGTASLIMAPVLGLLIAIAVPGFVRAREVSRANACNLNLQRIDAAKQAWAVAHKDAPRTVQPTWYELSGGLEGTYLSSVPKCPGGGTYVIGDLDSPPTCNYAQGTFRHTVIGK